MSSVDQLNEFIVGKCRTMCPMKEINLREKERLLHILEVIPGTEKQNMPRADLDRVVKSFNRSAAGKSMTNEEFLRPASVLLKTVNYLLDDIIHSPKVSWIVKYDFIMDRLRSVRQDMIIQNLPKAYSISLLQPMVRFYAYSAYKLCDQKVSIFDPYLNKKHLHECLNRLLIIYDDIEQCLQFFRTELEHVDFIKESRPEFEALYIILNLEDELALHRMLHLSEIWRTHHVVQTAILIALSYLKNNFARVCRYMKKLPPLLAAVCALHLPNIRRKCFHIMSVAYSCRNQTFVLSALKESLMYGSEEEVIDDSRHYGIALKEKALQFDKNSFNTKIQLVPHRKIDFVEEKLRNIDESILLLYNDNAL